MKEKTRSLIEGISESTAACLLTMVQGNVLALTLGHLMIAAQTGVLAGVAAFIVTILARIDGHWFTPAVLGLATAVVDFYVHPGAFGDIATEAMVTGLAAFILSYILGAVLRRIRARKSVAP